MDLSPGTAMTPWSGFLIGSIRFMIMRLGNLRAGFISAHKFLFQQAALFVANPSVKLFEIFDVVAQRPTQGAPVHQTNVAPQFRPARGDAGKVLEAAGTVALEIDPF